MNRPLDVAAFILTLGVTAIALVFTAAIWLAGRTVKRWIVGPKPAAKSATGGIAPWIWVLIVATVVALWILGPKPKAGAGPAPNDGKIGAATWFCLATPIILVLVFLTHLATQYRRYTDGAVVRGWRRANEGDVEGAIGELEHEIESRGPTANRLNGLATLHMKRGDFATAIGWCRKGLAIEPSRPDLQCNYAACLLKTGQVEEAEARLAEMVKAPGTVQAAALENHARALMALGRLDEAEAQLDRAEAALKSTIYLTTLDIKGEIRAEIASARAEIAARRAIKDKRGLEEL